MYWSVVMTTFLSSTLYCLFCLFSPLSVCSCTGFYTVYRVDNLAGVFFVVISHSYVVLFFGNFTLRYMRTYFVGKIVLIYMEKYPELWVIRVSFLEVLWALDSFLEVRWALDSFLEVPWALDSFLEVPGVRRLPKHNFASCAFPLS